jgi:hypothetical protein
MAGMLRTAIRNWLFPKNNYGIKPIERIPSRQNHSALTCTPLLEIYGSLFCVDNFHIVYKDDDKNPKVLAPMKILPRSKGGDFEAYLLDDGFAIRYKDHDYFFMAQFEIVEAFGMRIFDIKQPIIQTEIVNNDLCTINNIKEAP